MSNGNRMLNHRQQAFVNAYLVSGNATQAAVDAGYSEKTAYSQGQRLLKNVEIVAALAARQQKAEDKADVTLSWTLRQLKEQATFTGEGAQHGARVSALSRLLTHFEKKDDQQKENTQADGLRALARALNGRASSMPVYPDLVGDEEAEGWD